MLLFTKKNKSTAEFIFLLWILSSGYATFCYQLVYNGEYLNYPTLTAIGSAIPLLSGPFMYLYIKYQTQPLFFKKNDFLHFIPFLVSNLLFIQFFFLPFDLKVHFLQNNAKGFEWELLIKSIATYLSGIIYITWSFISLYSYKKKLKVEFSNLSKVNFNWMLLLNIGLSLVWIIIIIFQDDRIIFSAASIYVICIGFFGINQAQVFAEREIIYVQNQDKLIEQNKTENRKTDKELKEEKGNDLYIEEIYLKAMELLTREKLYLNPELKILDLAILLNIHPHIMSKAINQISESNFYDLINKLRVEEFINMSKTYDMNKYTIIGLAFEAGFNSKASFYRNFKSIVGMSPTEFLLANNSTGR